jgi:hypothetical protein
VVFSAQERKSVVRAVLAVLKQRLSFVRWDDIHELKVLVEPPEDKDAPRSPGALVLEDVLTELASGLK